MKGLVTISLRAGIAMPDGGYSGVLVGFIGERVQAGQVATIGETSFVAQQPGFYLHADENAGPIKALIYDDAVAGICECLVPPDDACDLRHFNLDSCQYRLDALRKFQKHLLDEASEKIERTGDEQSESLNPPSELDTTGKLETIDDGDPNGKPNAEDNYLQETAG